MKTDISFRRLRKANEHRQALWCPAQIPDLSFRGNELAGETGEACNVIKKLERERFGWSGSRLLIDRAPGPIVKVGAVAGVKAVVGDAISILPTLTLPDDAVVYCDPPYVLSTRKFRLYYEHEMTDCDHVRLLNVLKDLRCRVLISGYHSELYVHHLQGWRCCSFKARTRGKTATEFLWMNFPEPEALHDWRYAGFNYRQRLAMKRLAARWLARLEGMPPRQRGYVLAAISDLVTPNSAILAGSARNDVTIPTSIPSLIAGDQRHLQRGTIAS